METTTVSPQELYHAVWRTTRGCFYERSRLNDWSTWEHRFDNDLHTDRDAHLAISEMLGSLRDSYTYLELPAPPTNDAPSAGPGRSPVWSQWWKGDIGYIKIETFTHNDFDAALQQAVNYVRGARALIIDVRGNSGGKLINARSALTCFVESGTLMIQHHWSNADGFEEYVFTLDSEGVVEQVYNEARELVKTERSERNANFFQGCPMVVLVDERSGSAAELFAGTMRDLDRAVLIGRRTAGKGIGQNTFTMPNGCELQVTTGIFMPPSRQFFGDHGQTSKYGLEPHINVPYNPRHRGDEIADVAFRHLRRHFGREESSGSFWGLVGAAAAVVLIGAATRGGGDRRAA